MKSREEFGSAFPRNMNNHVQDQIKNNLQSPRGDVPKPAKKKSAGMSSFKPAGELTKEELFAVGQETRLIDFLYEMSDDQAAEVLPDMYLGIR